MSEPAIIVIPEEYYGGAFPKPVRPTGSPMQSGMSPSGGAVRKFSPKIFFIVGVSVLFVAVVGFAAWYFTKPLRTAVAPLVPETPLEEVAVPTLTPEVVEPAPDAPISEPAVSPTVTPDVPPVSEPFSDSDNDKLTFAEEELYHTQATTPDTDADGFLDGHEVVNLYNPSGIAPEKLEIAKLVVRAINTTYGYEILYPSAWQAPEDFGAREIVFSENGDSITVSVIDNRGSVTLTDWALQNFGKTFSAWTSNKAGLTGLFGETESGLRAAFEGRGRIYLFQYTSAAPERPIYRTTFEMMLNSFRVSE